jgi:hypothetical protein
MKNKNDLVVKSNRLVEASYRLTLAEQRIILFAIVEARRTQNGLSADNFVDILAADYAAMFDVPLKQAYEQIKEAALTLFNRYVILHGISPKTGKPEVMKVRWLSAASYIDGEGTIRLRFAPDMVPYITHLEAQFTRYKLEKVANMSSPYAIRLYELLMQWGSVGKREIELKWLKKTLMVEENYERLGNFKKRVIDVAVKQINEHSDLTTSYAQRKTGRNVTHLTFTFAPKEEAQPRPAPAQDAPPGVRGSELFQRLRGHGVSAKLATAWIQQGEARALAAVEHVGAQAKAGKIKGPAAGYLRTLFDLGAEFGPPRFEADLQAQAREAEEAARRGRQREAEAKRAEAEHFERERKAMDLAMEWFGALPEGERRALEAAYLAGANPFDADHFRKKGSGYTGFRFFVKKTRGEPGP